MFTQRPTTQHSQRRPFIVIGLLVTIFIVALGVFLVRQRDEPSARYEPPPQTHSERSTEPRSLVLAEWGVRFRLASDLGVLQYKNISRDGQALVGFTTQRLLEIDGGCTSEGGAIGIVERSRDLLLDANDNAREPFIALGGYNYYFASPQASCLARDQPEDSRYLSEQIGLLRTSLTTLELVH